MLYNTVKLETEIVQSLTRGNTFGVTPDVLHTFLTMTAKELDDLEAKHTLYGTNFLRMKRQLLPKLETYTVKQLSNAANIDVEALFNASDVQLIMNEHVRENLR